MTKRNCTRISHDFVVIQSVFFYKYFKVENYKTITVLKYLLRLHLYLKNKNWIQYACLNINEQDLPNKTNFKSSRYLTE